MSMVAAYGGDMVGYSNDGFVWSCRMDVALQGPKAGATGIAWAGRLRYTQFSAGITLA